MQTLKFHSNPKPTLGVEIELGIVDSHSMELASRAGELLAALPDGVGVSCKPELMQCCIEINSDVGHTVAEIARDLRKKIVEVERAADRLDLGLWWGATHPFSQWMDQQVTPNARYEWLVEQLQEMARRLITFGLHVHVGVDSGDKAVMICDRIMQYLPVLLALSTSSPYWEGRDTGLQSYRSKIMEGLPTAGLPTLMRNWSEYLWIVNHLIETGFIHSIREIWWDVRPHHAFGTVEVRVCDMPGDLSDVLSLTALTQCLIKALSDTIDQGAYQHDCHPMMVRQNKWRACRYGNQARLVDSYTLAQQTLPEITRSLVTRLQPQARELNCQSELGRIQEMAARSSWSQRQRDILRETGDPREIVRRLHKESRVAQGSPAQPTSPA